MKKIKLNCGLKYFFKKSQKSWQSPIDKEEKYSILFSRRKKTRNASLPFFRHQVILFRLYPSSVS